MDKKKENTKCDVCSKIKEELISVSTITYQHLKVEFVKSHYFVKDVQDNYKVVAK